MPTQLKISEILARTEEVSDDLESFVLTHEESDLLAGLVTEHFAVSGASLFPLAIPDAIQLDTHFVDDILVLLTSNGFYFGQVDLRH